MTLKFSASTTLPMVLLCKWPLYSIIRLMKHQGPINLTYLGRLPNLVVVDFTASWCGPCKAMAPILAEIAKRMPHVMFLKVDVDELSTVAKEVETMPTFIFLIEGKLVDKIVGAQKEELHAKIVKHAPALTA